MNNGWPEHYLGIQWKTGGRDPMEGVDCWGLLRVIYRREFGVDVTEHVAPVGALASPGEVMEAEIAQDCWVELISPEPGDVVALGKARGFSHVGVYVMAPAPSVLHIIAGGTACVTTLKELYRKGYGNVKFYRHVARNLHH